MKILYGIQSTGNGHISRSQKIVTKLVKLGCMVDILLSGKNSQLPFPFPVKYNLTGFTFHYNGSGKIDYWKTFFELKILQFLKDIRLNINNYDIIISDFEPITAWASKLKGKECIGISNQCSFLSDKTPRPIKKNLMGEFILKWMAPVSKPIGIHFEKYDEFIHTPIIKDSLKKIITQDRGHYVVYLPTFDIENIFRQCYNYKNVKFDIFSNVKKSHWFGKCHILPIRKDLFEESLRTCHGVITNGGFQTASESLFLGKKLMVIPTLGQYEQLCNAKSLENIGCKIGQLNDISDFIESDNSVKINWKDSCDDIIKIILGN